MLIFRQLFDQESSTYTYLLGDAGSGEALLIDAVFEQVRRDLALLRELGLRLTTVLDTHCHADHVTSAWLLKQRTGCRIGVSADAGVSGADLLLRQGDRIRFGGRHLGVRETPGHTAGCLTYVLDDESMAFTGDALLIRGCGRTDFQQGDPGRLYRSIHTQIFSLPGTTRLFPAHDYNGLSMTSVAEEKRFNPRCGGDISERDFIGYMNNLGLAHPKKIDVAVPANLQCGRPADGLVPDDGPDWAPLFRTFAGVWEIEPHWLEENAAQVHVLDVREPDEFDGPLGHIEGAQLIPLGSLAARIAEVGTDKPIVTVCRAGGRSAQATVILQRAGIGKVANLAGGMLRWRAQGYPVVGGVAG
jgi:glyoxylase-like metal-dependent hydrolase (beta-lactamase superfamily II)/rhodanese-related sulfurtransferase